MGKRHHLRYEEEYALNGWLLANKERVEKLTKGEQLAAVNQELSFRVTQSQLTKRRGKLDIKCTVKRTVSTERVSPPKKPNGKGVTKVALHDLALAIEEMRESVAILVKYQATILDQLGVKYGTDLAGLVHRIEAHQKNLI